MRTAAKAADIAQRIIVKGDIGLGADCRMAFRDGLDTPEAMAWAMVEANSAHCIHLTAQGVGKKA